MAKSSISFWVRIRRLPGKALKRIARVGRAIVAPFEWLAVTVLRALFRLNERFEDVESLVGWFGRLLFWPVRRLLQLLGAAGRAVVPRSVRALLAAPFYAIARVGRRVGMGLLRVAEWLNLDALMLTLARWTRPIWYPFAAVGAFFGIWIATRPYKKLLWGLPLALLIVPILLATAWGAYWGKSTIAEDYRVALARALGEKDYVRAQLLERKLEELGINSFQSEFKTAQTLAADGKLEEAYERMQRLGPANSPGYPPAHIWILQQLLSRKLNVPEADVVRLAGAHLDHLTALGIRGPDIDMVRAVWLTQGNRLEEAADLLKPLAASNPAAATHRLRIDVSLDRRDQALLDARDVCEHFRQRPKGGELPDLDFESWAAAEELLGNRDSYSSVLQEWLKCHPESSLARQNVAMWHLRQFDEQLNSLQPKSEVLAVHLQAAFSLIDATENMKERVALLYRLRATQPALSPMFEQLAKSSELSASLLETLGTAAAVEGKWGESQVFLDAAVRKDPTNAVAWNNLACALLQQENASLDGALSAADKALGLRPDDFRFRETRGEIMLRLGRWQEAVDDLEYALNGAPGAPVIHRSLSQAYEGLGNQELATVHRQLAK